MYILRNESIKIFQNFKIQKKNQGQKLFRKSTFRLQKCSERRSTWKIGAGGVLGAGVLVLALVVVGAGDAVSLPAVVANADETFWLVETDCVSITIVGT